jgi:hypothetical protein
MRIDEFMRANDIGHDDLELEALLGGKTNTTAAARMWASIADGSASVWDALAWVQHVARKIDKNVVNGSDRDAAPAALRAIGYYGRVDKYRTARDYLVTVASFDSIDEAGNNLVPERLSALKWLRLLRSAGHLLDVNDKTAINHINAWRKELGIE